MENMHMASTPKCGQPAQRRPLAKDNGACLPGVEHDAHAWEERAVQGERLVLAALAADVAAKLPAAGRTTSHYPDTAPIPLTTGQTSQNSHTDIILYRASTQSSVEMAFLRFPSTANLNSLPECLKPEPIMSLY